MIVYYLGLPGSGKSYSGVNTIYNNFSDNEDAKRDLKKDYQVCYTNINEFKFDKVKNVYPFDEDDIFKKLNTLYEMYKKKATDEELIEKCKEYNLYKALFVLDECHKYFDVERKFLVWWLTYHRHLYHDLILITQSLALVNSKYKPLAEAFFKAKSSSLTLNKKYFNYMYYTESRLTRASFVNTVKVKKRQSVFDLYKSGDSIESKNVIKHFLYISLFFLALIGVFIFFFYDSKQKEIHHDKASIPASSSHNSYKKSSYTSNEVEENTDYTDSVYMKLICDLEMCSYQDIYFDIKLIYFAQKNFNLEIINSRKVMNESMVSVVVDRSFISFLKGGENEDDSSKTIGDVNLFSSSK